MLSLRKLILPLAAVAAFSLPGIAAADCTAGHGKTASVEQPSTTPPATQGGKG
ncbi:MAG: hypothetical protein RBS99_06800 [Rhodospirillales bacterium]|nr:hypothetical protein [Rhodospirillales bacterium]